MKTRKYAQTKLILWVLVYVVWFFTGCQMNSNGDISHENTNITDDPPIHLQTPTKPTISVDEAGVFPSATALIQPSATATEQQTHIVTLTPMPTVVIKPQIAVMAGQPGNHPAIGVFNTEVNALKIIADPTNDLSYGRPLWSPSKDLLAFTQFDSNIGSYSIQVYNLDTMEVDSLKISEALPLEDDTQTGLFLYGWSYDSQWLAYCYIYESLAQICYTANLLTQESSLIELPNSTWFVWSPHSNEFALTDSEAIYVGNPYTPDEMTIYQGSGFLGLMTWHPIDAKLLVGSGENMAGEGLNQLKLLDINTGEIINIGSFPNLAHFAFSSDGRFIAVHLQSRTLDSYRLAIIDTNTFESIKEIELPAELFFNLDWLDSQSIALTSKDNIYVLPLNDLERSYWVLDNNSFLYKTFSQITFTDW